MNHSLITMNLYRMTARHSIATIAVAVLSLPFVLSLPAPALSQPSGAAAKPLTDAKSLATGKTLYETPSSLCITCHRADLGGLVGPNLTDDYWLSGCGVGDLMTSIRAGNPSKGMLPFGGGRRLTDAELVQVASYILSKRGSNPSAPKARDAVRDKPCK